MLNFVFFDPEKAHPCAKSRFFTYFASQSVRASLLWAGEEPKK